MKNYFLILFAILLINESNSQTIIATSTESINPTHQSQRRIVRDSQNNLLVVYEEGTGLGQSTRSVIYDNSTETWGNSMFLANGGNPTLAIGPNGKTHRLWESLNSEKIILYSYYSDFNTTWEPPIFVSDETMDCRLPMADVDSAGVLNTFWIQKEANGDESLFYANFYDGQFIDKRTIITKDTINDLAVATHLQYVLNDLFFAIQYNNDSVIFLHSNDYLLTYDTLYQAIGSQPTITINSEWDMNESSLLRMIYIDENSNLMEIESHSNDFTITSSNQIPVGQVDLVCVDNLAPPIGYSYLFMQNNDLKHGFSYGATWSFNSIMETITGDIHNPSIAYKHFNFEFVDFIWQVETVNGFDLYHLRDDKHEWASIEDNELGKGFKITGYPNPFNDELTINIELEEAGSKPIVEIYNTKSQLVKKFICESPNSGNYKVTWKGTNQNGEKVDPGLYVIMCTVDNNRTARKVMYVK